MSVPEAEMVQVPLLQRVEPARAGEPISASVQPGGSAAAQGGADFQSNRIASSAGRSGDRVESRLSLRPCAGTMNRHGSWRNREKGSGRRFMERGAGSVWSYGSNECVGRERIRSG